MQLLVRLIRCMDQCIIIGTVDRSADSGCAVELECVCHCWLVAVGVVVGRKLSTNIVPPQG